MLQTALAVILVISSISLIFLVMLQQGKGADAGIGLGGASQTLFGGAGSDSTVVKLTKVAALAFFLSTIGVAYVTRQASEASNLVIPSAKQSSVPSKPVGDLPSVPASTAPSSDLPVIPKPAP
jgi:preprotein translocase subunit SecG